MGQLHLLQTWQHILDLQDPGVNILISRNTEMLSPSPDPECQMHPEA